MRQNRGENACLYALSKASAHGAKRVMTILLTAMTILLSPYICSDRHRAVARTRGLNTRRR